MPSKTRCGARLSSSLSFALAGSPSAAVGDDDRPTPLAGHGAQLAAGREAGPAAAGQAGPLDDVHESAARCHAARGPAAQAAAAGHGVPRARAVRWVGVRRARPAGAAARLWRALVCVITATVIAPASGTGAGRCHGRCRRPARPRRMPPPGRRPRSATGPCRSRGREPSRSASTGSRTSGPLARSRCPIRCRRALVTETAMSTSDAIAPSPSQSRW